MSTWDGLNRRQFPRITYPCLIVIRGGDNPDKEERNNAILTHTDNVGVGGVCMTLKQKVKTFCIVDIELDLLDLENHICCKGKVVWNVQREKEDKSKPQFYDVGIEFMDINDKDRSRLEKVIKRLEKNNS